jgi:putative flippase GtrA
MALENTDNKPAAAGSEGFSPCMLSVGFPVSARHLYQMAMGEQRSASLKSTARSEVLRLVRYGAVGLLAAGTHFLIAWLILQLGAWPGAANAVGYLCGFVVSYLGQSRYTFGLKRGSRAMLARWAGTQIALLILSSLGVQAATSLLGAAPLQALGVAIILVALAGYLAGRLWVFREEDKSQASAQ